jgi:hypothetical protein
MLLWGSPAAGLIDDLRWVGTVLVQARADGMSANVGAAKSERSLASIIGEGFVHRLR